MNNFAKIQAQLDDINAYLARGDNLSVTEHENRLREFQNNSKIKPVDDYDFVLKKSISNNNHLPRWETDRRTEHADEKVVALTNSLVQKNIPLENKFEEESQIAAMMREITRNEQELEEIRMYSQKIKHIQSLREQIKEMEERPIVNSEKKNEILEPQTPYYERLERVERLLVRVLQAQKRQEAQIASLRESYGIDDQSYAISQSEEDYEYKYNDSELLQMGLSHIRQSSNPEFVKQFLSLLSAIDTDEKRNRCLEAVQGIIHDHFYEDVEDEAAMADQCVLSTAPYITEVKAVDTEYLQDMENNYSPSSSDSLNNLMGLHSLNAKEKN